MVKLSINDMKIMEFTIDRSKWRCGGYSLNPEGSKLYNDKDIQKFSTRITIENCWIWNRGKNKEKYGYMSVNKALQRSHRISFQLFKGVIPEDKIILHTCDNPPCCNPDHLILGTKAENNADRARKGRNRDQTGSKNNIAKLDWEKVREIRNSTFTRTELMIKYSVSRTCIQNILVNTTWREINNNQ